MSDHDNQGGKPGDTQAAKHEAEAAAAQAKAQAAQAEKEAKFAAKEAKKLDEEAHEKAHEKAVEAGEADDPKAADKKTEKATEASKPKTAAKPTKAEPVEEPYVANPKPELDDDRKEALRRRSEEGRRRPAFVRQEWFRYKRLGGKNAPWRKPDGMHSKMRRHFKYRPPVVSVGYRGPAAARGLHPSGFEDILVHRPEDLDQLDPKTQAARIGGTVGGRKAELIEKKADEMGIRILNRRS